MSNFFISGKRYRVIKEFESLKINDVAEFIDVEWGYPQGKQPIAFNVLFDDGRHSETLTLKYPVNSSEWANYFEDYDNFHFEKNRLSIHTAAGTLVKVFPGTIERVLQLNDLYIILFVLEPPKKPAPIIAINQRGEILWESVPPTDEGPKDFWSGIGRDNEGLAAGSMDGWNYHIDPKTGKIIGEGVFVK